MFEIFNKLLLIDGSYMMYRSYYGYDVNRFRKADGQPINCVFGVARQLLSLIKTYNPSHIAFCFDKAKQSYRYQLLEQYKAGRPATPDELKSQYEPVREFLDLAGIKVLEHTKYEADDIIASLSKQASDQSTETRIFSADKDMYQLINDYTLIIRPSHKSYGLDVVTSDDIVKKYGILPNQYCDFAALVGESADNIPGVAGCGPKTATKWIQKYGSLENLIKNADSIDSKVGKTLLESVDQVLINRKVNQLILDADLGYSWQDFPLIQTDINKLNHFFEEWEMKSLVNKFVWQ